MIRSPGKVHLAPNLHLRRRGCRRTLFGLRSKPAWTQSTSTSRNSLALCPRSAPCRRTKRYTGFHREEPRGPLLRSNGLGMSEPLWHLFGRPSAPPRRTTSQGRQRCPPDLFLPKRRNDAEAVKPERLFQGPVYPTTEPCGQSPR